VSCSFVGNSALQALVFAGNGLEMGDAQAAIHPLPSLSPFQGRETYKERLGNAAISLRLLSEQD